MIKEIKKLQNALNFYADIVAANLGLFNSSSDYCKFIVLGQARSGSNFLRGLLDSHSQVITYGELFVNPDFIGWHRPKYDRYLQTKSLILLMRKDPKKFLEQKVFRKYASQVSAVGFKIFYDQAREDSRKAVWDFLQSQKDIKVIHLKRKNMLRTFLSLKKALTTKEWIIIAPKVTNYKPQDVKISLTYEECLQYFNRMQDYMSEHDIFFAQHQKIDVFYEELSINTEYEIRRIQDFLELDYKPLKSYTLKQSSLPLSQSISNYFELKEKFQNTPWEGFFED
ncbi:sulfotransferase [Anabaena sp. UHCC 0451]|uniref:sulfotransferase family protein n=1 Tax=Anabaena sp. UHCC 0451 TaxID=2055235 RepID=UPI002B21C0A6|nr:sulfotransferase [Anabaena sp. UHCC 0451]MEA5578907.1 sulfotransferase [Anabaena sp. UHCC 0451]